MAASGESNCVEDEEKWGTELQKGGGLVRFYVEGCAKTPPVLRTRKTLEAQKSRRVEARG